MKGGWIFKGLKNDRLVAVGADADVADFGVGEVGEVLEVTLGVLGEVVPGAAFWGVAFPAGEFVVDGGGTVPSAAVSGGKGVELSVDIIGGANLDGVAAVEAVEDGDGEFGDAIDHAGEADESGVEPATAAGATSGGAEFKAEAVHVVGEFLVFGDEGARADAGGVGFAPPLVVLEEVTKG